MSVVNANPTQETPKVEEGTPAAVAPETPNNPVPAGGVQDPANPNPGDANAEKKPDEQKPVVPEKYELKMPDGSHLDPGHVEKVAAYAKERGLSNEQAQAVLDRENSVLGEFVETNKPGGEVWTKRVNEWEAAAMADKEVGGSKEALAANAEMAKRVLAKFFPETVAQFLNESGYGSHPDTLRGFVRLGKAMSEDKLVLPNTQGAKERSMEDIFYGNQNTKEQ